MRHLFDQYSQPENRLTHALISSLSQDKKLLRKFVKWTIGKTIPHKEKIHITEQSIPGQDEYEETEATKKGIPDAWIYTDNGWALLIESKVSHKLTLGQLKRHMNMALKRGFPDFKLLIINVDPKKTKIKLHNKMLIKSWSELYEWGIKNSHNSEWAGQFTSYLEIAEAKMIQKEYLKEGKLTKFSGIPFSSDNPYSYYEAKRILSLLVSGLKNNKMFVKKMGADPNLPGRGAITGRKSSAVWDFLRIKESKKDLPFIYHPHLTISIMADLIGIYITLPNGMGKTTRKRTLGDTYEAFEELMAKILKCLTDVMKTDPSAKPIINVLQRHYPSQRSFPIHDARLFCDLRTVFSTTTLQEKPMTFC